MPPQEESKHVVAFRNRHLKPDERILAFLEGYIGEMMGSGKDTQHNGSLVVTDHRVAFYRKGMLGEVLETIPLEKLTSVERRSMMGHVTIRMHTSHDDLAFKTFDKENLENVIAAIENGRDRTSRPNGTAPPPPESPLIALQKLGELRAAGIVSDEEFEAKKKDLLSRL